MNSEIPWELRWNDELTEHHNHFQMVVYLVVPKMVGPYASIPVVPTTTNMINKNLRSANPPPVLQNNIQELA